MKNCEVDLLGVFVTAKLKGVVDCRQGWIVELNPLVIHGESGAIYECEGYPVVVDNPPAMKVNSVRGEGEGGELIC